MEDFDKVRIEFTGQEWFDTLPEDVQIEWCKQVASEDDGEVTPDQILNQTYSELNWFIWASFVMRNTHKGLKYWEKVINENYLKSKTNLYRSLKINELGL
jgi:hypothetical protein